MKMVVITAPKALAGFLKTRSNPPPGDIEWPKN